jgi:hypothetical protein
VRLRPAPPWGRGGVRPPARVSRGVGGPPDGAGRCAIRERGRLYWLRDLARPVVSEGFCLV